MFRVVETFSGIGSQAKALKNINADYEITNTADWDVGAIIAYYFIHRKEDTSEKYSDVSDEIIDEYLRNLTLSMDGKTQIADNYYKQLTNDFKRLLYTAIKETNNLVSVTDIKAEDIPENADLLTYSFPCQDLSLCGCWHGNMSGIARAAHNRSGMLWEIERILKEMNEKNMELPRFLLMENVPNILSKPHEEDFGDWKSTLNSLGYINKIYRLNARNFGIPQKRERAYMISIRCSDKKKIRKINEYFEYNNLEEFVCAMGSSRRKLKLSDILCLDYSIDKYRNEADASKPNDTPSRKKIRQDNEMLYDGKNVKDIAVNTLTTKQDRNPNSGLITYKNRARGKTKWRYLTPRECFKLMGFEEEDFDKVIATDIYTDKSGRRPLFNAERLYKLAGNSIVVDVLEAIFKQIIFINSFIMGERK